MNLAITISRKNNIPEAYSICVFILQAGVAPAPSDSLRRADNNHCADFDKTHKCSRRFADISCTECIQTLTKVPQCMQTILFTSVSNKSVSLQQVSRISGHYVELFCTESHPSLSRNVESKVEIHLRSQILSMSR